MNNLILTPRWSFAGAPNQKDVLEAFERARNHPTQQKIIECTAQYKVIAAGRRSFKTERFLKRRFIAKLFEEGSNRNFFLGAPTRAQAKLIFWEDMKALMPKWLLKGRPRESDLTIEDTNGNRIIIIGLEEFERVEGTRWDACGITEYQKVSPEFFGKTLQPILNDTGGEAILEGRPLGKNHFFDDFNRCKTDPKRWASFHWISEDILTKEQIYAAKADMAIEDYRREYMADFETGGQRVYYAYSIKNHKKYILNPSLPVIVTCDFNAGEKPMSWTIGQMLGQYTYWTKSLSHTYTNTITMCGILDDYFKSLPSYPKVLNFYGDYSGTRHTSNSSLSDWEIIENYFNVKTKMQKFLKNIIDVRDRVAATNARLENSLGEQRMFVDPENCKPLIRDWERAEWRPDNRSLNDSDPRDGHSSDSVDYFSDYVFPIKQNVISYQF